MPPSLSPYPSPSLFPHAGRAAVTRRGLVLAALALAGCGAPPPFQPLLPVPPPPGPPAPPQVRPAARPLEELEPLLGYEASARLLAIRVASRGCTARSDIVFYVERAGGEARLAFARRRLDLCLRRPGVALLAYSWTELGIRPGTAVVLLNPLARPQAPRTTPPGAR